MSAFLKQATASQVRAIGPFIDDTDFKSPETGLTIANTDIKLVVNGGASANKNSGGGTHRSTGMYGLTFDATDTATVGEMEVLVNVAGALPVRKCFFVVEEAVYDALFAASATGVPALGALEATAQSVKTKTDFLPSVTAGAAGGVFIAGTNAATTITTALTTTFTGNLSGSVGSVATGGIAAASFAAGAIDAAAVAANAIGASELAADAVAEIADAVWDELQSGHTTTGTFGKFLDVAVSSVSGGTITVADLGIVDQGTAQSATGTTLVLRSAAAFANDELIGSTIVITGGTGIGQSRVITDYVGATDTATVDTWTTTPSGTITYNIYATPPGSTSFPAVVNATQLAGQTITAAAGVTFPTSVASPTNITAGTITTVTNLTNAASNGDLTATMKTSVTTAATAATPVAASVTGAVGSVTGNIGGTLTSTERNAIADATLDRSGGIETGLTPRQAIRLIAAAEAGKLSGAAGTTVTVRNAVADSKDRIVATVDEFGNRSALTIDVT